MATPILPTPAEDLANQIGREFARLKSSGVDKVDFSQLITNIIHRNGINDPHAVSYLREEIGKIFAQRRAERAHGQQKLSFRSNKIPR